MNNIFTANGRFNRLKYFLYNVILSVIWGILQSILFSMQSSTANILLLILGIAFFYVQVCITIKRFHDLGKPGIHYLLLLIPLYNIYLALVLLFKKGETGPNAYGEDPLGGTK